MTDGTAQRLEDHARRLTEIERTQPAVISAHVDNLRRDVIDLRDEIRSLKRAFYGFALSVTGSAIIFSATAFAIWGN